jgi:tetratricopeptide (TPR) repeat protein
MKQRWLAGMGLSAALLLGFAVVYMLQGRIDSERQAIHEERDELLLRSPSLVKKMSLEYAPLMAAIYWTRAVQYYGEKTYEHDRNLETLWPLLDITTTLDPQLLAAYRFGAIFLSEAPPRGAGRPDLAVRLLERGLQENPDQWRLYQDLGNVYYFDAKDYPNAARAFMDGSKNPAAPIWMKTMAAKIAAEGESPEMSYFLWQDVYQTTTDPAIKKNAESHLRMLKVDLDVKAINAMSDEYEKHTGRRPARMSELVQAGLLNEIPPDSEGYPYVLGEGGKARLNPSSPLVEEKSLDKR